MKRIDRSQLARDLHHILQEKPNQNKRQLLRALEAKGWSGIHGHMKGTLP